MEIVDFESCNKRTDAYIILILGMPSWVELNIRRTSTACSINLSLQRRAPKNQRLTSGHDKRSHGPSITLLLSEVIDT